MMKIAGKWRVSVLIAFAEVQCTVRKLSESELIEKIRICLTE